jgi:prepilin-type N-terminal cleavage/methylation domain-containing protein
MWNTMAMVNINELSKLSKLSKYTKYRGMTKTKLSAFSLIELSIVIIILGLLTAGVMGGANLIRSSKVTSLISDSNDFRTATNSYVLSYGKLPGDSTVGNDNGRIEYVNS